MGDQTWVRITYAKADEKAMLEAFNWPADKLDCLNPQEEHGIVTSCFDAVNWGGIDETIALAKKGVTFVAHAGAGGSKCGKPGITRPMSVSTFDLDQGTGRRPYQQIRAMPRNAERDGEGHTPLGRYTLPPSATLNLVSDASASPSRFALHTTPICTVIGQRIPGLPHPGRASASATAASSSRCRRTRAIRCAW